MAAPRRPRKTPARQPGRPSARTAQDVRGQLIAAARDLFLKYGYRAVSSRQVAAAAGANPAMIHYYFGNKHGLYKAMLEQAIGPGVARLNAMLEAPPEEASVARMLDTYMHILEANPWIPGLLLREVLMPDGAFRDQFIRDFGSRFAPRVAELVRHETLSGHLRKDLDPAIKKSHPGGTLQELMTVYTIVNCVLTNLPDLQEVQILIGGQEADTLAGHVDLRRPLRKNDSLIAGPSQ